MIKSLLIIGVFKNNLEFSNLVIMNDYINFNLEDIKIKTIFFNISNKVFNHESSSICNTDINSLVNDIKYQLFINSEYNFCYMCNPYVFIPKNLLVTINKTLIKYNTILFRNIIYIKKPVYDLNTLDYLNNIKIDKVKKISNINIINNLYRPKFFKIKFFNSYLTSLRFQNLIDIEEIILRLNIQNNYFINIFKYPIYVINYNNSYNFINSSNIYYNLEQQNKVSVKNLGKWGLGNQMFQYCALYKISKIYKKHIYFIDNGLYDLIQLNFFKSIEGVPSIKMINNFSIFKESSFSYDSSYLNIKNDNNIILDGFFQSYKYFDDIRDEIINIFKLTELQESKINKKYKDLTNQYNKITSLHIRRGDYLNYQELHRILPLEYYKKSIAKTKSNTDLYLVFSDDIKWCKENMSNIFDKPYKFVYNDGITDLILMSKCNNNIIGNSSFSWWSAYLNINKEKIVICPKKWFNDGGPKKHDLFLESWIQEES